ncbi:MAG: (d)CMP kinase [Actinomycetes bacterium]|jgi:CMP/dCMP kinase
MSKPLVIAVDGPSGSGKSSVCRAVATQLGLEYLDTGSMYRAVTWYVQSKGVDLLNTAHIAELVTSAVVVPSTDPAEPGIKVGGVDVSEPIRGEVVTQAVSAVSAVPEVRQSMVSLQREIVTRSHSGIVVEGRDICAVVLPDAPVKLFITAEPQARAARRAKEVGADMIDTNASMEKRDHADSTRAMSPLEIAKDATVIDTTHMKLNEVINQVIDLARSYRG